ncbi:uncharacterized protein LOC141899425 isoform X2 [Tubulanus polymorphus]|uniref:uncharacterized protein LOC141899425 isoform X2 n=1 Tax=Tubulanus polymorphus TaxID=672921 RepID=UPI003DA2C463
METVSFYRKPSSKNDQLKMGNLYEDVRVEDIYNLASMEISHFRMKHKQRQAFTTPRIRSAREIQDTEMKPMYQSYEMLKGDNENATECSTSRCSTACSIVLPKSVTWDDRSTTATSNAPRGFRINDGYLESPRSQPDNHTQVAGRSILKSHDSMTLIRSRSAQSMGAQCIRSESRVDPDLKDQVNPISRQICDVLGPVVCHICGKIKTRSHSVERCASQFPSIHISEDHFKKALLLSKHMPGLTTKQLQEKVAHGEVSLGQLKSCSSKRKPKLTNNRPKKQRRSVGPDGTSWMFFRDIRDLDHRISSGVMDKMAEAMPEMFGEYVQKRKDRIKKSLQHQITPQYMSDDATHIKSKFPLYYEPPMLSIDAIRDRAKHDFFADQKGKYKLPERLPENIIPPEVTKALEDLYEQVRRDSDGNDKTMEDLAKRLRALTTKRQRPPIQSHVKST